MIRAPGSWRTLTRDFFSKAGDVGFIWRGQGRASWGLESSLERAFKAGGTPLADWNDREQSASSYFRAHAATFLEKPPADTDILEWLAIMQHYGAPTRLLDWSESPFVATYFAYKDMPQGQEEPAALWAFDAELAITSLQEDEPRLHFPAPKGLQIDPMAPRNSWTDEINRLVREHMRVRRHVPLPVVPARPDARMTAQQTVLTVDSCLDGGISHMLSGGPQDLSIVFKIELPASWRRTVLRELALMGITDATLFADIGGVARHTSRIIRDGFVHVRSVLEGYKPT